MNHRTSWLHNQGDIGLLILRLFIGVRLLYGLQDNIFHWDHMKSFASFLESHGFPFPLLSAIVSVYVQALAALFLVTGWMARLGAFLILVNFIVAVIMVHWGQSFEEMTTVLFLVFSSLLFIFTGPGRYAIGR